MMKVMVVIVMVTVTVPGPWWKRPNQTLRSWPESWSRPNMLRKRKTSRSKTNNVKKKCNTAVAAKVRLVERHAARTSSISSCTERKNPGEFP